MVKPKVDKNHQIITFSSNGRLNRSRYFIYSYGFLLLYAVAVSLIIVGVGWLLKENDIEPKFYTPWLAIPALLIFIYLKVIAVLRRFRDTGLPNFVGVLLFFIGGLEILLLLWPSENNKNVYGEPCPENSQKIRVMFYSILVVLLIVILLLVLGRR